MTQPRPGAIIYAPTTDPNVAALTGQSDGYAWSAQDSAAITAEATSLTVNAYTFKAGYAYEVTIGGKIWGGTSTNMIVFRLREVSLTGANPWTWGRVTVEQTSSANAKDLFLRAYLAVTGSADITTALLLTGTSTTGGTVYHGALATEPRYMRIHPCGTASYFPYAGTIIPI